MSPPVLADFIAFIRNVMGIPVDAIADDSPVLKTIFRRTQEFMPPADQFGEIMYSYTDAFLNLGGALLIQSAPDVSGSSFFDDLRDKFKMTGAFRSGVITSSTDHGTSATTVVGTAMSNLSLADLQLLQTPYGRSALAFLQELGTCWGIS